MTWNDSDGALQAELTYAGSTVTDKDRKLLAAIAEMGLG